MGCGKAAVLLWVCTDGGGTRERDSRCMNSERVVIAGGGVGALEGMLAVQELAGRRADVSVLTAGRHLTYRALSVTEPFSGSAPERYEWGDIARDQGITWIPDVLVGLRPGDREVDTRDGGPVAYDSLLLALGARPEPAVPGAITFAGPRDVLRVIEALEALADDRRQTVAFVAAGGIAWTLPLYELALLTIEYAKHHGLDLNVEIVTRESVPLGLFGAAASADVARRLAAAGIHLRTGTFAKVVEHHTLWLELEGTLEADLVIALPRLTGQTPRPAVRRAGVRSRRRLRSRAWPRPRVGRGRHDDATAQAGRPRHPAGRRRRGGHRVVRRRGGRRAALSPCVAGLLVHRPRAGVPRAAAGDVWASRRGGVMVARP